MRKTPIMALALAMLIAPGIATAADCSGGGKGKTSIHYDTGVSSLTEEDKAKLARFAETAKFRDWVCVFAQVDAQGSDSANATVAQARADTVRDYLVSQGVPAENIRIAEEKEAFTLFGLLPEDSKNDRMVTVSHE